MAVQLWVALLRCEDGEWIEPTGCCYRRHLVDFEHCANMPRFLQGTFAFQCYAEPGEDPLAKWNVTHVGVMPFAGMADPVITQLNLSTPHISSGNTIAGRIQVPRSMAELNMPTEYPALQYT